MTPLFCEDLIISASSPVRALDKLAANGITAYSARRIAPGKLKIRVKCKETAKIFAIFRGSCYTVTKAGPARLAKLRARALRRPGILAGLAAFVVAAYCVNIPVLRIDVTGSARYEEEAYAVLAESGVRTFALCGEEEREAARRALLALPGVVFASVEKAGCVVTAVIEESEETPLPERERELLSPRAGKVEELAVLRGTPSYRKGTPSPRGRRSSPDTSSPKRESGGRPSPWRGRASCAPFRRSISARSAAMPRRRMPWRRRTSPRAESWYPRKFPCGRKGTGISTAPP